MTFKILLNTSFTTKKYNMKLEDQYSFLQRRLDQEQAYFKKNKHNSILKSLSSVDITTIDLCNRTCVFCPRHNPEVYPNRNLRMTSEGAEIIAKKLQDIDYSGTIAISGFGENLLNPDIIEILTIFKKYNPTAFVECNTNGDPLTSKKAQEILSSGIDCLNINLYDGPEQIEYFDNLLLGISESKIKYRAHWNEEDHGIIYNNRSGLIQWMDYKKKKDVSTSPCYYPFYKMMVDWNGDILFCANDWGRVRIVGNLLQQSVAEVWMSKEMSKVRNYLKIGDRSLKPCNTCSVDGMLVGKTSFDLLVDYYEKNSSDR